jgi:hypothetical protein
VIVPSHNHVFGRFRSRQSVAAKSFAIRPRISFRHHLKVQTEHCLYNTVLNHIFSLKPIRPMVNSLDIRSQNKRARVDLAIEYRIYLSRVIVVHPRKLILRPEAEQINPRECNPSFPIPLGDHRAKGLLCLLLELLGAILLARILTTLIVLTLGAAYKICEIAEREPIGNQISGITGLKESQSLVERALSLA